MPSLVEDFRLSKDKCISKKDVNELAYDDIVNEVNKVHDAINRPIFTPCTVNANILPANTSVTVMIDSGSSISIIDNKVLQMLNNKARRQGREEIEVNRKGYDGALCGVGENRVDVKGTCCFYMKMGPITFPIDAVVIDKAPTEVLLGVPEMYLWGLVPDVTKCRLYFSELPNESIKMSCKNFHSYPLRAVVSNATKIPARSQKIVRIQPIGLPDKSILSNHVVTAVLIDECRNVYRILVPNTFINMNAPQVIVTNPTNEDILLSSGLGIVKLEVSDANTIKIDKSFACNPLYDVSLATKNSSNEWKKDESELEQLIEQVPPKEKVKIDTSVVNYSSVEGLDLSVAKSHLSVEEFKRLIEFVEKNKQLWRDRNGLGNAKFLDKSVFHDIDVGDHMPIAQKPYMMGYNQKVITDEHTSKMLAQEVIEPSRSPWASPVVLAPKPNGGVRFCIDFRKLNAVTKKDVYPLPRMSDLLDAMQGAQYFSTLDLLSGYWQIPLTESAKEKTAFITSTGLYQWKVMPFGLCNAPASFQRMMDVILAGLKWNCSLVYLDDVIVFSRTFEDHLNDLQKVFDRLHESDLILSPSKCTLCSRRVKYLGHIVSNEGISCDPKKIESIKSFPQPTTVTEVRSFIGLAGYYRRFIHHFAARVSPIIELTKDKVPFVWTDACEKSFQDIKKAMQEAPILRHPDFKRPFIVDTDACKEGLGAILMQVDDEGREYVIAYASKKLNEGEKKWNTTEHEAFAIVWAVDIFRPYLLGSPFVVRTDHKSLQWLNQSKNSRLIRWALRLEEFQFIITHRSGKQNSHADALSRSPVGQAEEKNYVDGLPEEDRMNDPIARANVLISDSNHLTVCRKSCRKDLVSMCRKIDKCDWISNSLDTCDDYEPRVDIPDSSDSELDDLHDTWVEMSDDDVSEVEEKDEMREVVEQGARKERNKVILKKNEWDEYKKQFDDWCEKRKQVHDECVKKVEIWLSSINSIRESQVKDDSLDKFRSIAVDLTYVNVVSSNTSKSMSRNSRVSKNDGLRISDDKGLAELSRNAFTPEDHLPADTALNECDTLKAPRRARVGELKMRNDKDDDDIGEMLSNDIDVDGDTRPASRGITFHQHSRAANRNLMVGVRCDDAVSLINAISSSNSKKSIFLVNGLLVKVDASKAHGKMLLIVPKSMRIPLTIYVHNCKWFSHFGVSRTLYRLKEKYYFPNMREIVEQVVRSCELCQRHKRVPRSFHGVYRSLSKVGPWDTLGIDIFGPLPTARSGVRYVVVVIDQFTKWVELFACKIITTEIIADILVKLISRFGCPRRLLTDRGSQFNSQLLRDLCYRLGVHKVFTSAYRPQADGIAEAFMKVLGRQLAILTNGSPKSWSTYLEQIAFAYRTTPHPSTGETPFYLMYGYDAQMPDFHLLDGLDNEMFLESSQKEVRERLRILRKTRKDVMEKLILLYEKNLDKNCHDDFAKVEYEIGQLILIKTTPIEEKAALSRKLVQKWSGPYRVKKVMTNELTYEVESLESGLIKTVHVGNTRPFLSLPLEDFVPFDSSVVPQPAKAPMLDCVSDDSEVE